MGELRENVLVCGGTSGIGFAFALHFAKKGCNLTVLSRDKSFSLESIKQELLYAGAQSVQMVTCDLLDSIERGLVFARLASNSKFSYIFLGGPGPVAGSQNQIESSDVVQSYNACVSYPIHWHKVFFNHLIPNCEIWVLSSSTVNEESTKNHPFYLSTIFRKATSAIIKEWREQNMIVNSLTPRVVITPLSMQFGEKLADGSKYSNPIVALEAFFEIDEIPTAEEYISQEIEYHATRRK